MRHRLEQGKFRYPPINLQYSAIKYLFNRSGSGSHQLELSSPTAIKFRYSPIKFRCSHINPRYSQIKFRYSPIKFQYSQINFQHSSIKFRCSLIKLEFRYSPQYVLLLNHSTIKCSGTAPRSSSGAHRSSSGTHRPFCVVLIENECADWKHSARSLLGTHLPGQEGEVPLRIPVHVDVVHVPHRTCNNQYITPPAHLGKQRTHCSVHKAAV